MLRNKYLSLFFSKDLLRRVSEQWKKNRACNQMHAHTARNNNNIIVTEKESNAESDRMSRRTILRGFLYDCFFLSDFLLNFWNDLFFRRFMSLLINTFTHIGNFYLVYVYLG